MSRPKVLVTGARGKLASRAIPELAQHFDLHLTDLAPNDGQSNYTKADLTGPLLEDLCAGQDAILHMAIASEPAQRETPLKGRFDPFEDTVLKVNVLATSYLFEAARRAGVKKIIFVSSMTVVWGDKHKPHYDHQMPFEPKNLYACTKIFGENLARLYHREYGMSVLCLRIGQPYPINSEVENLWRDSRRARSIFVTTEDVTRGLICALKSNQPFGIYNIVSASDNQRIDISHSREIGYIPRAYFTEDRIEYYDDGNFPSPVLPVECY